MTSTIINLSVVSVVEAINNPAVAAGIKKVRMNREIGRRVQALRRQPVHITRRCGLCAVSRQIGGNDLRAALVFGDEWSRRIDEEDIARFAYIEQLTCGNVYRQHDELEKAARRVDDAG